MDKGDKTLSISFISTKRRITLSIFHHSMRFLIGQGNNLVYFFVYLRILLHIKNGQT